MRFRPQLSALALLTVLASAEAMAEEPRLAVAVSGRPLAIGRFNLLLGAEPGVLMGGTANVYQVILPLRFGITDDLELFAGPVAQSVAPAFYEPALGVVYRFLRGPVEIGARAAGDLSLFGVPQRAAVQLGVPLRIHLGNTLAIDLGAHAVLGILPGTSVGVLVPAGLSFNVTDAVFIAVASGVRVPDLSSASATLGIPVSAALGYTIAWGDRPFIDLGARAAWAEIRTLNAFSVGASARLYLYF